MRRLVDPEDRRHYIGWVDRIMKKVKTDDRREAGALWGDPRGDEWKGRLRLKDGVDFPIKGYWSFSHENMLEVEVLHDDWIVLSQGTILLPNTGGTTFRGFIYYPQFVRDQMQGLEGEYFSFNWQINVKSRLINKQERAFRIKCGGKQMKPGRPPEW